MHRTDLSKYSNSWYKPGGSAFKRALWFFVNACFLASFFPFSGFKVFLLRLFGAEIGKGVVIKPRVNIKYPWKLKIHDHVWLGERVWIDNLDLVEIGANSCLSQGAFILCGNHNYKKTEFDLMTAPVILAEGVWIGAQAIVCPGVICNSHAVLSAGALANRNLDAFCIYQGNPAQKVKERAIE
jgi:putative colanic acid biosynthesis acetyltransferase WcaF